MGSTIGSGEPMAAILPELSASNGRCTDTSAGWIQQHALDEGLQSTEVSTIQEEPADSRPSANFAASAEHPWRDAAIDAEFHSGKHEASAAAARSHVIVRLARMALGSVILLLGVVAMIGPGPGILIIAVGLAILARDVAWADRMLRRVRQRIPTDSDGKIPRSSVITMSVVTLATVLASVWWLLR